MTTMQWDGQDVELNDEEVAFMKGLRSQYEQGEITSVELAAQVRTLMNIKTTFDATMLDEETVAAMGEWA